MALTIFLSVFCTLSVILGSVVIAVLIKGLREIGENTRVLEEANQILAAFYQQQEYAIAAMNADEDEEVETPIGLV